MGSYRMIVAAYGFVLGLILPGCFNADSDNSQVDEETDNDTVGDTDSDSDTDSETAPQINPYIDECNGFGIGDGCIRFVDVDVESLGDGLSWSTAFATVQEGIDAASDALMEYGDGGNCHVWVSEGSYYIYESSRYDTVLLRPNVFVYGGFAGAETECSDRDVNGNPTILDGNDGPEENSQVYAVVTGSDDSRIDGFIVTGGNANGEFPDFQGGGMLNRDASPTVANCIFQDNRASDGGGMFNSGSSPAVINSKFIGNVGEYGGGGMANWDNSYPRVINCEFSYNNENGMQNWESGENSNNYSQSVVVTNCVFVHNGRYGMDNNISSPIVTNCTFSKNGEGGIANNACSPRITNCILWDNGSPEIENYDASADVTYSVIEDGYSGTGNIFSDPLLDESFELGAQSPCINAGENSVLPNDTYDLDADENTAEIIPFDFVGNTRIVDETVDMGAHEFQQ